MQNNKTGTTATTGTKTGATGTQNAGQQRPGAPGVGIKDPLKDKTNLGKTQPGQINKTQQQTGNKGGMGGTGGTQGGTGRPL